MSAEVLRRAAALMREQHGPDHVRHEMWVAMAALLGNMATGIESGNDLDWSNWRDVCDAVAVARAYLGES